MVALVLFLACHFLVVFGHLDICLPIFVADDELSWKAAIGSCLLHCPAKTSWVDTITDFEANLVVFKILFDRRRLLGATLGGCPLELLKLAHGGVVHRENRHLIHGRCQLRRQANCLANAAQIIFLEQPILRVRRLEET